MSIHEIESHATHPASGKNTGGADEAPVELRCPFSVHEGTGLRRSVEGRCRASSLADLTDDLLTSSPEHEESLFKMLEDRRNFMRSAIGNHFNNAVTQEGTKHYHPALGMFEKMSELPNAATDKEILTELYKTQPSKMKLIFGNDIDSAEKFMTAYSAGRNILRTNLWNIRDVLTKESFPATYGYDDVVALLTYTGSSTDEAALEKRVGETGKIILGYIADNQDTSFLNAMLLNQMHVQRFKFQGRGADSSFVPHYNEGSAAFVLLTFSYLPAEAHKPLVENEDTERGWYFFWKVIGSLMGMRKELLPEDHAAAKKLYDQLLPKGKEGMNQKDREALLATYKLVIPTSK